MRKITKLSIVKLNLKSDRRCGRKSDIKILQETPLQIHPKIKIKGDLGYQGIEKIHLNSKIPHKKPKNEKLTKKQKRQNK